MRHARVIVVALFVLGLAAERAFAQLPPGGTLAQPETDLTPEQEQRLLAEYWTLAKRYLADPAAATKEMSAWTRDRVGKVQSIQYQPETTARPDYLEGKAEWKPETLRLAAMLHSDIAIEALRAKRTADFEFHAAIADGWFALADNRKSAPGSLRSRWNVTVARLLLASGESGLAERSLERIANRIPNDSAILLAYGTVHEAQAMRLIAEVGAKIADPTLLTPRRDAHLADAAANLEKALGVDATLVEAQVRLAHVYILQRHDDKAEPILKQVTAAKTTPVMKYLASLMLGGVRERRQELDVAARTYLEAVQAVPTGQSAYIALAELMQRGGQAADAATVIDRMLALGLATTSGDPWWTYAMGLNLSIDAQLEEYRAAVRK